MTRYLEEKYVINSMVESEMLEMYYDEVHPNQHHDFRFHLILMILQKLVLLLLLSWRHHLVVSWHSTRELFLLIPDAVVLAVEMALPFLGY